MRTPFPPGSGARLREELADQVACRFDPELHDGPEPQAGESPEWRAAREEVARQVCAECPLRTTSCLAYVRRVRPKRGVWAGLTPEQIAELPSWRSRKAA
ncbi:WhiB family transcriptional regulator [Actinomadura gamaensis]|uniref:WhiB family transcriptional regulator n=1 Tax=Actinomadura gamaensis TaxID=1763541 RepID=A0ABV9U375_9ACTN